MANKTNPENVDDNRITDGSKTTTSFIISSAPRSSQEDNSTASAVQDTAESRFYLPPWGTVFCIMAFLGVLCVLALRVSLSVAIVAMVNQTAISDDHVVTTNISDTDQCPRDQELERADGELTWDRHQQGTALAAFYYGQIFTQVTIASKHKLCERMVDVSSCFKSVSCLWLSITVYKLEPSLSCPLTTDVAFELKDSDIIFFCAKSP